MSFLRIAAGIALVALLPGCASIVSGNTQTVSVVPMRNGAIDATTTCTVTNRKGSWVTNGGGSVTVKKASDDIQVKCIDLESNAVAIQSGPRTTQVGWAVANFFLFDLCTISCLVDFGNGSIYEYPTQVQLVMPPLAAPVLAPAVPVESIPAQSVEAPAS